MKEIQVTLYDVFGYLIPGFMNLVAGLMVTATLFNIPATDLSRITPIGWTAIVCFAYVLGHLVQAIANMLMEYRPSNVHLSLTRGLPTSLPSDVLDTVWWKTKKLLHLPDDKVLSANTVFDVCDHWVQQYGRVESRDLYVYREGFYRGLSVSFSSLVIAAATRLAHPVSSVVMGKNVLNLNRFEMIIVCGISLTGSFLSFQRFRRFGQYLVKYAVYSLIIAEAAADSKGGK